MSEHNYQNYIIEADLCNESILLVTRENHNDKQNSSLFLIHQNKYFRLVTKNSISINRLFNSLDFIQYCLDLFNSKNDTHDTTSICLNNENQRLSLYGRSVRTSNLNIDDINRSDLLFIQVKIQDTLSQSPPLDMFAKREVRNDFTASEITRINDVVDKFHQDRIKQAFVNNDFIELKTMMKNHTLVQITKDITLSKMISYLSLFITIFSMFISLLSSNDPAIESGTTKILDDVKELIE